MFRRIHQFGGHNDSVLCADASQHESIVASGGQDGVICIHDASNHTTINTLHVAADEAVSCLKFSQHDPFKVYCSAGTSILEWDLRKTSGPVQNFTVNEDEINQIALNKNEHFLAACDDAGQVKVIDLKTGLLYKTLKGGHDNIITTVFFPNHSPWWLLSGGMDQRLALWDFSRAKCLEKWLITKDNAESFNPPMVHHMAGSGSSCGSYKDVVAVARGDGVIELLRIPSKRSDVTTLAELSSNEGGHTRAACCVDFIAVHDKQLVISGGEDGRIIAWSWDPDSTTDDSTKVSVAWHRRARFKLNAVCAAAASTAFYVADTSKHLKMYVYEG